MYEHDYWLNKSKEHIEITEGDHDAYLHLILAAKDAYTNPYQSGFHVLTAARTINGHIVTGGNKEYAQSDAFVHGETAVISRARDEYGETPLQAIAFYTPGQITEKSGACPCGNCRDVMRRYCSPDLVLIEGNEQRAVISRLSDYLFDQFHTLELENFLDHQGVQEATHAAKQAVSMYLPENLKNQVYGVALVGKDTHVTRGSLYTNAGYDAVTPALAAVQTWRNTLPSTGAGQRLEMNKIVIAGLGQIPDVFYRDRQALLEFDEVLRQHDVQREKPLPVVLVNVDAQGKPQQVQVTDTEEWLPNPFSPRSFGMDAALQAQLLSYICSQTGNSAE